MALNPISDLLQGIKRLFVGMQGVKSDLTMETIKTNDVGALKVSAELTGRKLAVLSGNYDQALNVAAGSAATITITPPAGELWRIKNLYLSIVAPTGGTAGTHSISMGIVSLNSGRNLFLKGISNYQDSIRFRNGMFDLATSSKQPTTETAMLQQIQALTVTNTSPLIAYYENLTTGGTQTGTILITVNREVNYIV